MFGFVHENASTLDNPLLEFARFEAIGGQPSKSILVLYADASDRCENVPSIKVCSKPNVSQY